MLETKRVHSKLRNEIDEVRIALGSKSLSGEYDVQMTLYKSDKGKHNGKEFRNDAEGACTKRHKKTMYNTVHQKESVGSGIFGPNKIEKEQPDKHKYPSNPIKFENNE